MKNRDKVLYMLLGALLVVLGMVLNHSIDNADANTQAENLSFLLKTLTDLEEANPGSMGKISTFDTILCKRIMCVNKTGAAVAAMGFGASGGILILNDNEAAEALHLSSGNKDVISYKKSDSDEKLFSLGLDDNDNGVLNLHNKVGTNTATLGHGKTGNGALWLHDKAGTNTSMLGHDVNDNGSLSLHNKSGIMTSILGHDRDGNSGLWLHDKAEKNTSMLGFDKYGHGSLSLHNKSGILTSILGNDEYGHGSLHLCNKSGIRTSTLGHIKPGNGELWLYDKVGKNTSALGHDEYGNNYLNCENLVIQDKNARRRAFLGLSINGDPMLKMYGDDGKHKVAYLGVNTEVNNEMMFELNSKSKTDKGKVRIMMSQWGG